MDKVCITLILATEVYELLAKEASRLGVTIDFLADMLITRCCVDKTYGDLRVTKINE